jgi:hypothetical protein
MHTSHEKAVQAVKTIKLDIPLWFFLDRPSATLPRRTQFLREAKHENWQEKTGEREEPGKNHACASTYMNEQVCTQSLDQTRRTPVVAMITLYLDHEICMLRD